MLKNIGDVNDNVGSDQPPLGDMSFTFGGVPDGGGVLNLGFMPGDIKFMTANKASEYTMNLNDAINKIYGATDEYKGMKSFVLDKEIIPGLYYSFIVIASKVGDKVFYFTSALESTGRRPMEAAEIKREYEAASKANAVSGELWTIDETYNIVIRGHIVNQVGTYYGVKDPSLIISADGCTINWYATDIDKTSRTLAAIAYNAILTVSRLDNPKNGDLNISLGAQQTRDATLQIISSVGRNTATDEMDNPVRSDWRIDLCLKQNKNRYGNIASVDELNKENSNIVLTKCQGYIDAIPDVRVTMQPGIPPIRDIRLRPHIIVTSITPAKPTIGFMLLGFLASRIMANRNMWLANVLPDGSKHHTGALNLKTCLEAETEPKYRGKPGMVLPFNGTGKDKLSNQEVYDYVNRMFALEPITSIDIPAYGPSTYYMSVLSAAASGTGSKNSTGALKALIDTIHILTNGNFPSNFSPADIFNHEGILVPMGTWEDPKTGALRDIREIDLAMIAQNTQSIELMDLWTISNLPQRLSRRDPYLTKVQVIAEVIPNAKIAGKAARVTFTKKFMVALDSAAAAAGLNLRYEPEIKVPEDNSLSVMEGFLSAAATSEAPGFARPFAFTGPTYNSAWMSSGGRF